MEIAVIVLGGAILALIGILVWLIWVYVRPSAIRQVMIAQAQAEIERNAAIDEATKVKTALALKVLDAKALKERAERAEEKLRVAREAYLARATGDDLGDEFVRLLSGGQPDADPAPAVADGGPVGPDGVRLRPVDPFADDPPAG